MTTLLTFKDFIQKRLTQLIHAHPDTEVWHLFKDKLREKTAIAQLGCPTSRLYKVYETPAELDFTALPQSFVIKLTFQSRARGIVVVKDGIDQRTQEPMDKEKIVEYLNKHLLAPGTNVTHQKVIIEELLEAEQENEPLLDIKLFYFAGNLAFLQIIDPTKRPENRIYPRFHYSIHWQRLPIHKQEAPLDDHMERPKCLDDIIMWGNKIAAAYFPNTFIRLDFYPTNKGAVFGETTLAPNFDCTDEANILLGSMLTHHKIKH